MKKIILLMMNLKKFLDDNIFKIEKLSGKFIENIFIIIDKKILNLEIGIKKKNYEYFKNKIYLRKFTLIELKDLFRENYHNQKIMHIIINKYLIDGKKLFIISR